MCNVVVHPYLFLFNARICGDAHAGREAQNTDSIQTAYHTTTLVITPPGCRDTSKFSGLRDALGVEFPFVVSRQPI